MEPVTVFRSFNAAEAQMMISRLLAAGFHADLKDEYVVMAEGFGSPFGGVKIVVPAGEAEEALAFLAE